MSGVWHDRLETFHLNGSPLAQDELSGTPGPSPWENLVYVQCDGTTYVQTNVAFRGRPLHVRTMTGEIRDGILRFDRLGPNDPGHVGVSAGEGIVIFTTERMDAAADVYNEPDLLRIGAERRTRYTFLYRNGALVRTLRAAGTRIAESADRRVEIDPRGVEGPVHEARSVTHVFTRGERA
jgi:hypothetical protein